MSITDKRLGYEPWYNDWHGQNYMNSFRYSKIYMYLASS